MRELSFTSMFEPDWALALYLTKGAVDVGQTRKDGENYYKEHPR